MTKQITLLCIATGRIVRSDWDGSDFTFMLCIVLSFLASLMMILEMLLQHSFKSIMMIAEMLLQHSQSINSYSYKYFSSEIQEVAFE